MKRVVIDASAAVEYLLRTGRGLVICDEIGDALLIAPELMDVEVLSVLRRAVLRGLLDAGRAELALDDLCAWELSRISHVELVVEAWDHRNNVTAYDAMYVAAAQRHDAILLTADGPLSRAPNLGIRVKNVGGDKP